jgi:hypothetical protein
MPTLNELAYQAFSTNSGTTGTLNEVTYAYLAQVSGQSGLSLNEQWLTVLTNFGFPTGKLNERQMAYWASLGYTGTWNEMYYQWLTDGGTFGPTVRIVPLGSQPTEGYCEYPAAGSCTATRQYQAIVSGFDNAITSWVWSIEAGDAAISLGQGTDTVTVQTGAAGAVNSDTTFTLKIVASNADPQSAEREGPYTHIHREDLTVSIAESVAGSCSYDSGGGGESSCVSQATYDATIAGGGGNVVVWELSEITGGSASIISGQGTAQVVVQTSGGTPNVSYKLTCTVTSDYQTANDSNTYTQTKTDAPTPVFIGPDIDTTQLVEDVLMTPFDVSGRFTGETAGNYALVGTWPTGVSIDANGVLSGTPAGPPADYTGLQFQAGNTNGDTLSNSFTVQVIEGASLNPPVFVGPINNQTMEVGVFYNLDLRTLFTGDTATYTQETGTLPDGLSLDPSGVVSGTPTTVETQAGLSWTATNGAGADTTTPTITATVDAAPVFVGSIPDQQWVNGNPVSLDLSTYFTGGGAPTSYSQLTGTLPTGVTLNTSTGLISGTPTVNGTSAGLSFRGTNTYGSDDTNSFSAEVADSFGPAFHALTPDPLTYEMKGVLAGTGDLTTTHTADLYAPDHEGVYRAFEANEPVWAGGRVVRNLLQYENATLNQGTEVDKGNGVFEATATQNNTLVRFDSVNTVNGYIENVPTVCAIDVRRILGTGDVTLQLNAGTSFIMPLTSEFQRFSLDRPGGGTNYAFMDIRMMTNADVIEYRFPQIDQNVENGLTNEPGDYVKPKNQNSISSAKAFANANGNTVASNVVTEAVGAPLADVPYLQYYPAAQNDCLYSRDLTNAAWSIIQTGASSYDQVGLTGEPNTASLISDDDAANIAQLSNTVTVGTGDITGRFFVKKDTDQSRMPAFAFVNTTYEIAMNTQTGATSVLSGTGSHEVVDLGGWWLVLLQVNNSVANTQIRISPARQTVLGVDDPTATGSIIVGNVEVHAGKTIAEVRGLGPIFTEASAVATDAPVYSFDQANYADNAAWFYEHTISANISTVSNDSEGGVAFSGLAYIGLYYYESGGAMRFSARGAGGGTFGPTNIINALVPDTMHRYGWSGHLTDNTAAVKETITNAWSADASSYTGWSVSALSAMSNSAVSAKFSAKMRELQRYDITSYADGKTIIDDLMSAPTFLGGDILDLSIEDES